MTIDEIEIERYTPEVVSFYKASGVLIGFVNNEHEFNKLRYKLVEHRLTSDCYFMWNDIKITLSEEGDMSCFPRNLYDIVNQDMAAMYRLNKSREQK